MVVTKIEYQKQDKNRVNLYIDGKFSVALDLNDVLSLGLIKGQEIDEVLLTKIVSSSNFGKFFNFALNFLSFRPRSKHEILMALKRKTILLNKNVKEKVNYDAIVSQVIEKLEKIGQINDLDFAKWFIDQRNTFRPKGKYALQKELANKGISQNIIKKVFGVSYEGGEKTQYELAYKLAMKRMILYSKEPYFEAKVKLSRFLASRGFDWDTITSVVEKVIKKG